MLRAWLICPANHPTSDMQRLPVLLIWFLDLFRFLASAKRDLQSVSTNTPCDISSIGHYGGLFDGMADRPRSEGVTSTQKQNHAN